MSELRVRVESSGGSQVSKTFAGKDGTVRLLFAGTGSTLTFTNLRTNTSLSLAPNGAVTQVTVHPDGSSTWMTTGHNVLILFPTDEPAGPSTTLIVGQTVFNVDARENFTVLKVSGKSTDICAALSA